MATWIWLNVIPGIFVFVAIGVVLPILALRRPAAPEAAERVESPAPAASREPLIIPVQARIVPPIRHQPPGEPARRRFPG
jgi:hypothetical protein